MFHHMVMFRFKSETTSAQIDAITDHLRTLPGEISELEAYRFGPDTGVTEGSWDYAVAADFIDREGYTTYRDHPAHRNLVTDVIEPVLEEVVRVQF